VNWPQLDGRWNVIRTGGLLPPLYGVEKRIRGNHGETRLGPLPGVPFHVDGLRLRYRAPLSGFVDVLEPDGQGFRGRATFRGHELGSFELRRLP
jgi:hypothetical protein